jgi:hypothetical protein
VVSLTLRPFYPQGKSPCYPLDRRLGGSQCHSGRGGEFVYVYTCICVCFYGYMHVMFCLGRDIGMGVSPNQGLLPTVYKIGCYKIDSDLEQVGKSNSWQLKSKWVGK